MSARTRISQPGLIAFGVVTMLLGCLQLRRGPVPTDASGLDAGVKAVACVFGDELNVTLPPERVDALVATPGYRFFEPNGRRMTGWVLLNQDRISALEPDDPMIEAAIAYAHAKSLKPLAKKTAKAKPATKPKAKPRTKEKSQAGRKAKSRVA